MAQITIPYVVLPGHDRALRKLFPGLPDVRRSMDNSVLIEWTRPEPLPTDEDIAAALTQVDWDAVRAIRQPLLEYGDKVAIRCVKAGQPFPADWQAYTTALRDITKQADPLQVEWPTPPDRKSVV